jgi:hypothetical protein
MKRGRVSAADLSIVGSSATDSRPPIIPLRSLSKDEKLVFDCAVRENVHLTQGDAPLLMIFSRAIAGAFNASDASDFERLSRVALSAGTRLRLTQQSRIHPLTLGRRYADQHIGPKPWDRIRDEDDNDDEDK